MISKRLTVYSVRKSLQSEENVDDSMHMIGLAYFRCTKPNASRVLVVIEIELDRSASASSAIALFETLECP